MSDTYTPLDSTGYDPTRTPSSLTRFCKEVKYGAIDDSGSLQGPLVHAFIPATVHRRCEDLVPEWPLLCGG